MCIVITDNTNITGETKNYIYFNNNKWYFTYENTVKSDNPSAFFIVINSLYKPEIYREEPNFIVNIKNINVKREPIFKLRDDYEEEESASFYDDFFSTKNSSYVYESGEYILQIFKDIDDMLNNIDKKVFNIANDIIDRVKYVKIKDTTYLILAKKNTYSNIKGCITFMYEPLDKLNNTNDILIKKLESKEIEYATMHENIPHEQLTESVFDLRLYSDIYWNGTFHSGVYNWDKSPIKGIRYSNRFLYKPNVNNIHNIICDYTNENYNDVLEKYDLEYNKNYLIEQIENWNKYVENEQLVVCWIINTWNIKNDKNLIIEPCEDTINDEKFYKILLKYV